MQRSFGEPDARHFTMRITLPVMLAALAAAGLVATVLGWSSVKANQMAIERQDSLVGLVVSQLRGAVAHDQESATVWDDAVRAVRRSDIPWIDVNLGTWMHTYFGHDGAYVLDPRGRPIYAFTDGKQASPEQAYAQVATGAAPLAATLHRKLEASDTSETNDRVLSPGVADIAIVDGHPAVISVKPIVSDSGTISQTPGEEYMHVAIRFLDAGVLAEVKQNYLFDGLRFDWKRRLAGSETSFTLRTVSGAPVGYFIWQPPRPGTLVVAAIAPLLAVLFSITGAALVLLLRRLRKRSLRLRASEAEIRHLALHDALTGLPNRALFNTRLDAALASPAGGGADILYLDLDRFKQVNDTLGHQVGDGLICAFADRLRHMVGAGDTLARIGGDEFLVLTRLGDKAEAERFSEAILEAVGRPFEVEGHQITAGVSIGVALGLPGDTDRAEIIRRADIALYQAKGAGRGRFAIFDAGMDLRIRERRALESDLGAALAEGKGIEVFLQTLHSAEDGRIAGVEALARWHHPSRGWIAPATFIPIAEDSGLIGRLGEHVLRKACGIATGRGIPSLAVNVSAAELRNPGYAVKVASILLESGMSPRRLELEVTESTLADEDGVCEANIEALRASGVRIALDDFGTGFSSLSRLQRLPADRIKIDRSFVQGIGRSEGDEAIVKAILCLAEATGLKTTAEGVETREQAAFLKNASCDELQGFFLSKPMAVADLDRFLNQAGRQRSG